LIKGIVAKPTYNLLKDRVDETWHYVWVTQIGDNIHLYVDHENAVPPADALGYFPVMSITNHRIYKVELENIQGNHHFIADTQIEVDDYFNVPLFQTLELQDDSELYGFYLRGTAEQQFTVIQTPL
jgi:hypothetical protein